MNGSALPARNGTRRLRAWHVVVLIVVLAIVLGVVYAGMRSRARVHVVQAEYQDVASTVSTTGTVVPVHDFPARANFTGLVEAIYVHVGEKVHAGQMLLRLKDQYAVPRLDKARADLQDAILSEQNVLQNGSSEDRIKVQAELEKAQSERNQAATALKVMQQIQKNGSVSGAEIEAATQRLQTAQATVDAIEKGVAHRYSPEDVKGSKERLAAAEAGVKAEQVSWGNANISTPISGTVYVVNARLFDFVPAGGDMLHVADLNHLQVQASFEEPDITNLNSGEPVTITWEGAPGRVWHGHLNEKALAITHVGPRNVGECSIALDDDRGDLPINTNVAVVVTIKRRTHVLAIPREALRSENGKHYVYKVVGDQLRRTPVETGLANAMTVEITRGLNAGDVVVLHADEDGTLEDGLRVSIAK
jgi:HlyD family secretion protein